MHLVHDQRLDELRLGDWRQHLQDGLIGEHHRAFRHGIDVACEAERLQPLEERLRELPQRPEVGDVVAAEAQPLESGEHAVEAASEQVIAPRWKPSHEKREHRLLLHAGGEIGLRHGQLVEVREERQTAAGGGLVQLRRSCGAAHILS